MYTNVEEGFPLKEDAMSRREPVCCVVVVADKYLTPQGLKNMLRHHAYKVKMLCEDSIQTFGHIRV